MRNEKPQLIRHLADPANDEFLLEHSPFFRLTHAESLYQKRMAEHLKAVGMDIPRWRILMILHEKSPSTISEIAERALMNLSTLTRVAQRLARDGLVKLASNQQDARSTDVHITPEGDAAVEKIRAVASRTFRRATEDFSSADLERLNLLLTRLSQALL